MRSCVGKYTYMKPFICMCTLSTSLVFSLFIAKGMPVCRMFDFCYHFYFIHLCHLFIIYLSIHHVRVSWLGELRKHFLWWEDKRLPFYSHCSSSFSAAPAPPPCLDVHDRSWFSELWLSYWDLADKILTCSEWQGDWTWKSLGLWT